MPRNWVFHRRRGRSSRIAGTGNGKDGRRFSTSHPACACPGELASIGHSNFCAPKLNIRVRQIKVHRASRVGYTFDPNLTFVLIVSGNRFCDTSFTPVPYPRSQCALIYHPLHVSGVYLSTWETEGNGVAPILPFPPASFKLQPNPAWKRV